MPTPISREPVIITSPDTKWVKHPTDSKLLMSFSSSHIRVYKWDDLSGVAVMDLARPSLFSSPDIDVAVGGSDTVADHNGENAKIQSICTTPSGSHFLIQTILFANGREENVTSLFQTSSMVQLPATPALPIATPVVIPAEIQRQIEIPLGIISRQRLIFLDKNYWMCSWSLSPNYIPDQVQRHYFLPKDWLNVECLKLCALLPDGVFLIPNNGELAVVRSTGLNH